MPLPPAFPTSPYDILDPGARWLPDEPDPRVEKLPPLVQTLREQVKAWRDKDYNGATDTGRLVVLCHHNGHRQRQDQGAEPCF